MTEYIEREAFLKDIEERYCLPCKEEGKDHNGCKCRACWVDDMRGDVIDAPAADVAPVRHGRWICRNKWKPSEFKYECSICHDGSDLESKYCQNCGARMDGDSDAEAD